MAEAADAKKALGNLAFGEKQFAKAVEHYTEAIELDGSNAVFFSNRANAHIRMENFGSALVDATQAIQLNPSYSKAYYRKGTALLALFRYKEALKAFRQVVKIAPRDADAQRKLKECDKLVRKAAFEEAIRDDRLTKKPSETIDLDTMHVSDSYDGPRIGENGVDIEFVLQLKDYLRDQKKLHKKYAYQILLEVNKSFTALPSLVDIEIPEGGKFTVCGDVHGQYYDLINLFEVGGFPSEDNPFLFNGDLVDRGSFSVEVMLLIFSLRLCFPTAMFVTRGNHESSNMTRMYGFADEVKAKYDERLYDLSLEVFHGLPLAYCIQKKVFCVHGGLFKQDGVTLDDIRKINRDREPADEGLMCDMLWSDPAPVSGRTPSKRGVGVAFGPDVTKAFLETNGLDFVARSHEVRQDGYEWMHDGKLVTVFSAPNYCDALGNKAAIMVLDDKCKPEFKQFEAVWHPPIRPMHYASGFNTSMLGL